MNGYSGRVLPRKALEQASLTFVLRRRKAQLRGEPRFADSGLSNNLNQLALPVSGAGPAAATQSQLVRPPNQRNRELTS